MSYLKLGMTNPSEDQGTPCVCSVINNLKNTKKECDIIVI